MNKTSRFLVSTGLALLCASCAIRDAQPTKALKQTAQKATVKKSIRENQSKPSSPVMEIRQAQQTESPASVQAASLFRTPAEDIKLPTDAEIAEGQKVSSGKTPGTSSDTAPSISIKPPAPTTGSD